MDVFKKYPSLKGQRNDFEIDGLHNFNQPAHDSNNEQE